MLVQVTRKMLPYNGKRRGVGEVFDMKPSHAKLFEKLGRVTLVVDRPAEPELTPREYDHPGLDAPKAKRRYKRRDMQAE